MNKVILLKEYGPSGVVPIFYRGSSINLVEMTRNGEVPFILTDKEVIEAAKHGAGNLVKEGIIKILRIADVEKPVKQEQDKPVKKSVQIPEPATVIENDAKVDDAPASEPAPIKKINRSRRK